MKFDALTRSTISTAFLFAYLLLIASTIFAVSSDATLVSHLLVARIGLYVLIMLAWVLRVVPSPRKYFGLIALFACIAPYLLTGGYMFVIDTSIIFAFASALGNRDTDTGRFFIRSAYISAALVVLIGVLSAIDILPSADFEWGGRVKNSAGFTNPNTYYYYLFASAFIFFVFNDLIGFFLIGLVMALFYAVVESRTFFFAYILMMLYLLCARLMSAGLRNGFLWVCLVAVMSFGTVTAIYPLEVAAGFSILFGLDASDILSNRLDIISDGAALGSPQFGVFGGKANYADSLYVYFINGVGLVFSCLAAAFLFHIIWRKSRLASRGRVLVVSVVYMMIGCFEVPYSASSLMAAFFVWYVFFDGDHLHTKDIVRERFE